MTTYINIFGGPGSGKSTNAARTFTAFKTKYMNVELVTEVAKDFVWEERTKTMEIQPYITMKQYRNLYRLKDKVDFVITDAPLLLGAVYAREYAPDLPSSYELLIADLHEKMLSPSINIMLTREHPYDSNGRYQTESEAMKIDDDIRRLLDEYNIEYINMPGDKINSYLMKKFYFYY